MTTDATAPTELLNALAALRDSNDRHRVLADTMLHGVVHQQANGRIISVNPAAERILGKSLDEMLGSKLRALYQRRKGRDLFDLWLGLTRGGADPARIVPCFQRFMEASGCTVSAAEYRRNLERKLGDRAFRDDLGPLLRPDVGYDVETACRLVLDELVPRL